MSALIFTLKNQPKFTLDAAPLTPENLEGKTLTQIKNLKIIYGNKTSKLDTLFTVKGTDPSQIIIENSTDKLINAGQAMTKGSLTINGDAGDFLGQGMKNGTLTVIGNTGSWTGNAMSGGRININGNAGDYVGAGLPGDAFGMSNGLINIKGNAGDRVGDRMRRGIIIIQGKSGNYCGIRIHAGTIIVLDKVGKLPGDGMRRGTRRGLCMEYRGLTSSVDVTSRHQDEPLFSDSWSFRLNPVAGQVRAFWRLARLGVSASGCSSESTHTNVRRGARALQIPPPMSRGCGSARDRVGELHVHVCRH